MRSKYIITILLFIALGQVVSERNFRTPPIDRELSGLADKLWKAEENRIKPNVDYELNLQGELVRGVTVDRAKQGLFKTLRMDRLNKIPTIRTFVKLLDNYHTRTGVREHVSPIHEKETWDFLNEVMKTEVMKITHKFLSGKGLVSPTTEGFKRELHKLWFTPYRRRVSGDSSAFEHVFVGELDDRRREIIGFHNWIHFALQERKNGLDYLGFYFWTCSVQRNQPRLIKISFRTKDSYLKPSGSMLIGTTPEFELALYTVTFLTNRSNPRIQFGPCTAVITCHPTPNGAAIGSCYTAT
ncbi:unnamed protein product [Calicophoron daubneyi]|uniref:Uridylate-specific endoribonuclease n=1 Tax=Calicophoron daubneyi TaxID=300641 RepID=A0AAV2TG81_CALDB